MLAEENSEEERPAFDGCGRAVRPHAVVAEEVDECRGGDAAEPGEESEVVEPGANAIGAVGHGALHFKTNLCGVGAELDPVVYEKGDGCQGPNDGEEGEVAELDDHFSQVNGDVVDVEFGLVADSGQELRFVRMVIECGAWWSTPAFCGALGFHLLEFAEATAFEDGDDVFESEIDDLRGDGEVDDLFSQAGGIYFERCMFSRGGEVFRGGGKGAGGEVEDVKVGHNEATERDVDEGGKEDAQIGGYEVEDKNLLG